MIVMNFVRGYEPIRKKMQSRSKLLISCYNCDNYYQAVGDKEELCQNLEVLEYDMVVSNNMVCCLHWKPVKGRKDEESGVCFKSGVKLSGRKKKVTETRKKRSQKHRG